MIKSLLSIINRLPYISTLRRKVDIMEKNSHVLPGHFYSPIADIEDLKQRKEQLWPDTPREIRGINFNIEQQLSFLDKADIFFKEYPFPATAQKHLRYYFENRYYGYTDGLILYFMMRLFQPKRIIEAGSGFSSALMLDVCDIFKLNTHLTFIDPEPQRLESLLKEGDSNRVTVIPDIVQGVPFSKFEQLEANDILFIDSSHVTKTGSDVNYLLLEILPILKKGVIIHIHDIFYPFIYPEKWVFSGIGWNETYLVRALLSDSSRYEMLLFSDFLHKCHPQELAVFPDTSKKQGQSLWLRVS